MSAVKVKNVVICLNCLQPGGVAVPVGHEKGSQRDPYRESITLCPECGEALIAGNMQAIHDRYETERVVDRGWFS